MRTTVKAHSRSVKGKGNRPVRRHTRTKGAKDLKPRKKRGFLQRVMDALTPYSPVMLNKEKERSERIQAARKAAEFKRTNERYHVKNSSNSVVAKTGDSKHKLKPGEYIVDTHKFKNSNTKKYTRLT